MKDIFFGFTVDDVCYDGYSSELHLERILNFCGEEGLAATFFAVPVSNGTKANEMNGYIKLLKHAISLGHEVAQHGLEHDRFEVGIPPDMVLDLPHEGPARAYLKKNRKEIERSLCKGGIRQRLSAGRKIIEEAVETRVIGFRAPCLQTCDNLFHALYEEKYLYDSSRYLQKAGWDIINGIYDSKPENITSEKFQSLQHKNGLKTLPLTTDYTWYLGKDKFQAALELAIRDFDECMESGVPFIPVCHVSPVQEGEMNMGFEFYKNLLKHARKKSSDEKYNLNTLTLSGICKNFFV